MVLVKGKFSERDWLELLDTIRNIERRHPDVEYLITVADGDLNTDQALAMMKRTFPRLPGEEPLFGVIKDEPVPGVRRDGHNNPPPDQPPGL